MSGSEHQKALNERLEFIGLDQEARNGLKAIESDIAAAASASLDRFYGVIAKNPKMSAFFSNPDHMDWAKKRQLEHWGKIAAAAFDESYVEGVTKVGMAHARIGLEPRWYIGGYALLLESMIAQVTRSRWPSRFSRGGADKLGREIGLIVKAALLDMDYSISVYLDRLEAERQAAEAKRLEAEASRKVAMEALADVLTRMMDGDLESRIEDIPEEFRSMSDSYNVSAEKLRQVIGEMRVSAEMVAAAATNIASATEDLSRRTEQQAAGVEESAAAMNEISESVAQSARAARSATDVVADTLGVAEKSGSIVTDAVAAMGEIERSSSDISKIIGVIDEIAFQTNLLALNAGVEAARAGDAGRGFAVVAQEVRELAQRSALAAREIKTIISASSGHVRTGVDLVNKSGESLEMIIARISDLNSIIADISASTTEQAQGLGEINQAIASMDSITQQNAHMVENTSLDTRKVENMMAALAESLRGFKTRDPKDIRQVRRDGPDRRNARRAFGAVA